MNRICKNCKQSFDKYLINNLCDKCTPKVVQVVNTKVSAEVKAEVTDKITTEYRNMEHKGIDGKKTHYISFW